ncbi:SEFIR domain-containing protein [Rheinheimera hassiensis]|uniref:SEFIR domain-containing protein n=1 Tax=Rheinheimera hassiensis TaxID=1193627 RepID=UPI001F06F48C|nr:SEFIR domain-containing protein [Rheinheimera hassiensis]
MSVNPPKVFISYSHDSAEHKQKILALSDQLRNDGVDSFIDQYVNGQPKEGWQRWMEKQIESANFVLIVCTQLYLRRFRGEDREGGRGVNFEGVIISQTLYDQFQQNNKFIPVLTDNGHIDHVPLILKSGSTYYFGKQYEELYRVLTAQPLTEARPLGSVKHFPPQNSGLKNATVGRIYSDRLPTVSGGFFGREAELKLLSDALENGTTNIIQFIAPGGTGKTKMLRYWLDQVQPEKLIAWSFYSQGASEEKQPSATLFYSRVFELLDPSKTITDFANQPEQMGEYLADLLRQQNCLLILDGFEPLQHSSSVVRGELKDRTLRALLKSLAAKHSSLCIITTRIAIRELSGHSQPAVISYDLQNLDEQDGVKLLKSLHVTGSDAALLKAVNEYGCHALALHLLGNALTIYLDGDILKRDTLDELFGEEAYTDVERHAFKVMQAYKTWLKDTPELQLLYLLSLFDHPIEAEVLEVLWKAQLPGLTDKIPLKAWKVAIRDLREKHRLLSIHEGRDELLDCHPLIREYFGKQLEQNQPQVWQQAHKKLYEYYKGLSPKLYPDTLDEMRPLFHAVTHGCAAGLHQRALTEVYYSRISRKEEAYNVKKLGAFSDDLAITACFFTEVWHKPSAKLKDLWQLQMLGNAGFCLRALGRLHEALGPVQASIDIALRQKNWKEAAKGACNLSELQLILGEVAQAVENGSSSWQYADKSDNIFFTSAFRTTQADALHQAGNITAALALFQEAEQLQKRHQPQFPCLYSVQGFRYCELLLAQGGAKEVLERATLALEWAKQEGASLLSIALDQLSLGRSYLQQAYTGDLSDCILSNELLKQATCWLEDAVLGLRAAGQQSMLLGGLLSRAEKYRHARDFTLARLDLKEVFDIAAGSGMKLHLTDYHLEMARLLIAESSMASTLAGENVGYKNNSRASDLANHINAAAKLITETGYHRRDSELAALQAEFARQQVGNSTS